MRFFNRLAVLSFAICISSPSFGQAPSKIEVTAGKEYEMSSFGRFFFGTHWRDLWTTPFQAEVLDLQNFAGGLTPHARGGGFQTLSLRFKGGDGRYYKFRSIDKDPRKLLLPELQETFVAEMVKDQISTSHPFSAVIAAPLLNAVGVLNAVPRIVVMPNDERLGEHRPVFGGLLGTLEEHPDDTDEGVTFAGAEKVVGTFTLLEKMDEDNDEQVDAIEFLKARLMDLLIGDWDRHTDQWRWARYTSNGKHIWKPIPRDRDQAFCMYDGLIPAVVGRAVAQVEGYGYDYPKISDLTWSGRYLDRRILPRVERRVWDSLASFIQQAITDDVIERAVALQPKEWLAKAPFDLAGMIKSRRDKLHDAKEDFYRWSIKYMDLYCSDKDEFVQVLRESDESVFVTLSKRDKKTGAAKGPPFFAQRYFTNETKDIRIHLLGGDDAVVIAGEVDCSILVQIIGGKGQDAILDRSKVNGYLFSFLPIPDAEEKTLLYDAGKKSEIIEGPSTSVSRRKLPDPQTTEAKYEPPIENRGHDWRYGPIFGFSSDDGLIFGLGPILYEFGFAVEPYVYRQHLAGAYAFGAMAPQLTYRGDFYRLIPGFHTTIIGTFTELSIRNFFGQGNETHWSEALQDKSYYRVHQQLASLSAGLEYYLTKRGSVHVDASFSYADITAKDSSYLAKNAPSFIGVTTTLGVTGGIRFDSRDNVAYTQSGMFVEANATHFPSIREGMQPFTKSKINARAYLAPLSRLTFVLRAGVEKLWGDYPFYHAAFLGGENSLRGFVRERFSGDASLFGALDTRIRIGRAKLLLPAEYGLSLFGETGRVFLRGEDSQAWHISYGGGLWASFIHRMFTLSATVARSRETMAVFVTAGI